MSLSRIRSRLGPGIRVVAFGVESAAGTAWDSAASHHSTLPSAFRGGPSEAGNL